MELQIEAAEAGGGAGEAVLETYRSHLDVVLKDHPDDAETWILRGLAEESSALGRGQGGKENGSDAR